MFLQSCPLFWWFPYGQLRLLEVPKRGKRGPNPCPRGLGALVVVFPSQWDLVGPRLVNWSLRRTQLTISFQRLVVGLWLLGVPCKTRPGFSLSLESQSTTCVCCRRVFNPKKHGLWAGIRTGIWARWCKIGFGSRFVNCRLQRLILPRRTIIWVYLFAGWPFGRA